MAMYMYISSANTRTCMYTITIKTTDLINNINVTYPNGVNDTKKIDSWWYVTDHSVAY